jgi:hypothetical protein
VSDGAVRLNDALVHEASSSQHRRHEGAENWTHSTLKGDWFDLRPAGCGLVLARSAATRGRRGGACSKPGTARTHGQKGMPGWRVCQGCGDPIRTFSRYGRPDDPLCGSRAVDASPLDLSSEGASAQSLDGATKVDGAVDGAASQTLDGASSLDLATGLDSISAADTSADASVVDVAPDSPAPVSSDAPIDQSPPGPEAPAPILDSAADQRADSPADSPTDLALPDVAVTFKDLGATCSVGSECTGGNCIDGHCCGSSACPACQACTGTDGTCAAARRHAPAERASLPVAAQVSRAAQGLSVIAA